jgi:hypothetical protein
MQLFDYQPETRLEVAKKMKGKRVFVMPGGWDGIVTEVLSADEFLVNNGEKDIQVNIFDIRE